MAYIVHENGDLAVPGLRTSDEILQDLKTKYLQACDYMYMDPVPPDDEFEPILSKFAREKIQSRSLIQYIKQQVREQFELRKLTRQDAQHALNDPILTFTESRKRVKEVQSNLTKIYRHETLSEYFDTELTIHKLLKKLGDILCDLDIATNRIDMTSPNEANEEADVPNELVYDGTGSDASNPRRSTDRYNAHLKCYWEMYGSFLTIEVEKENYILLCELQDEKNDTASNAY